MFYSHEILTSRKYGVATVWLVATLGAKSNTKKVNKKAILNVDVKKACETIMESEAPMALRLQSNLLYGVSRVYDQQCGYVLSDAQAAQLKMRELLKTARRDDLDPSAAVARPDQLMLADDQDFHLDMALPALDFDFSNLELGPVGNSQRSSQSMLSIRHRSGSVMSSYNGTIVGLNIPSSSTQAGAYQLPHDDIFDGSSALKAGIGRGVQNDEEGFMYQDDVDFEYDDDGFLREITAEEREARRAVGLSPSGHGHLGSDSAAIRRVRKEHEDAIIGQVLHVLDDEHDFNMVNYDDDGMMLPDAEAFPVMTGGLGGSTQNPLLAEEDKVVPEEGSSHTAEAPAKRRRSKAKKVIPMDKATELRNDDLILWNNNYLKNMCTATEAHNRKKEAAQAKNNAEAFVFSNGLNGIGLAIGSSKIPSPLAMFSGASLMALVTGKPTLEQTAKDNKGTKRDYPIAAEEAEAPASKRARQDDPFLNVEDDLGRANFDDDIVMHDSSSGVEIGRKAPAAIADHPSSVNLPWNISTSVGSYQRGASSSIQGSRNVPSSISKRLISASPLTRRAFNLPGELDQFFGPLGDEMVMYGRSDNEESEVAQSKRSESRARGMSSSQAEFEIFGAAAQVDTQTAASSQWLKDALAKESNNFFEYVRNTIHEKADEELYDENLDVGEDIVSKNFVTFEELFDPDQNSAMVAAQAFYHMLSLATKKRVWVEQEVDEETLVPFGEIRIGVIA